jgi:hypothetical protein
VVLPRHSCYPCNARVQVGSCIENFGHVVDEEAELRDDVPCVTGRFEAISPGISVMLRRRRQAIRRAALGILVIWMLPATARGAPPDREPGPAAVPDTPGDAPAALPPPMRRLELDPLETSGVRASPPASPQERIPRVAWLPSALPEEYDERSWWTRWNASLVGVTVTVQTFHVLMVAAFTRLPTEVSGWDQPRFHGLRDNFIRGPRVDNDRYVFNWVAHPLGGSEFYMIGRNRGLTPWEGLAYAAFMSTFFEFFVESVFERASWQDLWITPVAGMALGELRWQAKKALEDPKTGKPIGTWKKILYVVLDPFDPIYNL